MKRSHVIIAVGCSLLVVLSAILGSRVIQLEKCLDTSIRCDEPYGAFAAESYEQQDGNQPWGIAYFSWSLENDAADANPSDATGERSWLLSWTYEEESGKLGSGVDAGYWRPTVDPNIFELFDLNDDRVGVVRVAYANGGLSLNSDSSARIFVTYHDRGIVFKRVSAD